MQNAVPRAAFCMYGRKQEKELTAVRRHLQRREENQLNIFRKVQVSDTTPAAPSRVAGIKKPAFANASAGDVVPTRIELVSKV